MDDAIIRARIGRWPKIDPNHVRQDGNLSEHEKQLVLDGMRKKGRPRLANLIRDVRIHMVVEALLDEGLTYRQACRRVAPFVHLSPSGVDSVVRKERLASEQIAR